MRKKVDKSDFDQNFGSMDKVSIFEALAYTGLEDKKFLNPDEFRTVMNKKKKMIRSDIKKQRKLSKVATKMDWQDNQQ